MMDTFHKLCVFPLVLEATVNCRATDMLSTFDAYCRHHSCWLLL